MTENYRKALEDARAELDQLLRLKDKTDRRVAQLRQFIVTTTALSREDAPEYEDEGEDQVYIPGPLDVMANATARAVSALYGRRIGFTDAVREVLKAGGDYMAPLDVKGGLLRMGIDLERKYANPMAVIHTTLKRLEDNREVDVLTDKDEGKVYRWKSSTAIEAVVEQRSLPPAKVKPVANRKRAKGRRNRQPQQPPVVIDVEKVEK